MKRELASLLPWGVVTTTLAAPAARAGVTAVMLVALTEETLAAGVPPKVRLVAPVKFVPVIVTVVPPSVEPVAGDTEEIEGALAGVT